MDTFFEQIISIRKTGKDIALVSLIWVVAIFLSALLFFYNLLGFLGILIIAGLFYGAYKLTARFNIEYEYIVTNGTMDVDKIISKSSRKRMLSFELATVSRIEKFNPNLISNVNAKELLIACDLNDPNAYLLVSSKEGKGTSYLVFAPEDRLKGAIVKFVPKYIANSAFKEA